MLVCKWRSLIVSLYTGVVASFAGKSDGNIVLSRRGRHPKTKNLLIENDVYLGLSSWLRRYHKYDATPRILQKHVNQSVFPSLGILNEKKRISEKTATRWLRALGWILSEHKKGIYIDGHERVDVVEYRKKFLDEMKEYERRMIFHQSHAYLSCGILRGWLQC